MSPAVDSQGIAPTGPEPERDLIERAKRDPEAFAELYRHHRLTVFRFALSRLGNEADAEDVVSEVFLRALLAIGRFRYTGAPLRAWLLQIAAHAIADEGRRQRRLLLGDVDDHPLLALAASAEELAVLRDQARRVLSAAERLCPAQRIVFALRLGQELSTAEVARRIGRSEGAAKLVLHRAVAHVRGAVRASELSS